NGTGATWIGYQDEWSGIAEVYVDGSLKSEVDTYATPSKAQVKQYSVTGLADGPHTLAIKAAGRKNSSSGGSWVWVDAFDVTSGGSSTPTTTSSAPPSSTTTNSTPTTTTTTTSTPTAPAPVPTPALTPTPALAPTPAPAPA